MIIQEPTRPNPEAWYRAGFAPIHYLQKSLQILQLDVKTFRNVAQDEGAFFPALLFFAVSGLASGMGQFNIKMMVIGPILAIVFSLMFVGLLNVLANCFGGTVKFLELYRPLGLAASLMWVQALPFLGPLLGIFACVYFAVVANVALESVAGLSPARAVAAISLLVGAVLFLFLFFFAIAGSVIIMKTLLS